MGRDEGFGDQGSGLDTGQESEAAREYQEREAAAYEVAQRELLRMDAIDRDLSIKNWMKDVITFLQDNRVQIRKTSIVTVLANIKALKEAIDQGIERQDFEQDLIAAYRAYLTLKEAARIARDADKSGNTAARTASLILHALPAAEDMILPEEDDSDDDK